MNNIKYNNMNNSMNNTIKVNNNSQLNKIE